MHGLDKEDFDREYGDMELLKRIISYFRNYKKEMAVVSIAVILSSIGNALVPILTSQSLDQLKHDLDNNPNHTAGLSSQIITLFVLILGFAVFGFLMNAVTQIYSAKAVQSSVEELRKDVFDSLLIRDMSFFSEQPTGRLVSRVTNDTSDFGQTITLTTNLIGQVLIFVFMLGYLFKASVKLTIITLMFAPIVLLVALSFRKIARTVALKSQRVMAKVNALIQETTTGIYVAKSFRAENTIYDEFDDLNATSYNVNLRRGLVFNSIFPMLNLLTGLATATIVYFGALEVINESSPIYALLSFIPGRQLTVGEWYLFITGLNFFFQPLVQIASFWSQFQQGLAGAERVFSLIDAENAVQQSGEDKIQDMKGKIDFKGVTFSYKDGINIFENFSMSIKAGEKIAIVGHTGAGKSTLSKLLSRYYEFQDGELLIDDHNIRSLDLHSYRNRLAIISQEVFLWNASIKENILYGSDFETVAPQKNSQTKMWGNNSQSTGKSNSKGKMPWMRMNNNSQLKKYSPEAEERMMRILRDIEALDWIQNLEDGFDMKVGERGSRLSQGQRQLVQFARILMQDPAILIMDEATASVDPFTELQIQHATDLLMKGRTSIVIAHRLSTVKNVDRIIVLKEGKILEEGSHEQLMANNGHYRELYDTYFRHQSLEYVEKIAKQS